MSIKVVELDETGPHRCDKLVSPNLVKVVHGSLRNVSEKLYNSVRTGSEWSDYFVANKQNQKPEKVNQVDDDNRVERPCKVNIKAVLCQWIWRLLVNVCEP